MVPTDGPGGFMEQRGDPIVVKSNKASYNVVDAHRLWDVSEKLTEVHYAQFVQQYA